MKLKTLIAIVGVLGAVSLAASPAYAIEGPRAVRHIKLAVKDDCHSYRAATCLYWEVSHCFKLGHWKVRCHALQQYRVHGNWRECRFNAVAVEGHDGWVHLHFGYTRCYSENGELI